MTASPRRTVDEVAAPYENFLVPMPAPAPDVCLCCHSSVFNGWTRCYPCNEARSALAELRADAVASVALTPEPEQLARNLYLYKDSRVDRAVRQPLVVGLAAVLYKWLRLHEACLAAAAGVGVRGFDLITSVPSTNGRSGEHPLETLLTRVVSGSADRYEELLRVQRDDVGPREFAHDRFSAVRPVTGSVLVVDDAWVSGARPQGAAAALKLAGAAPVAVLTIGRWFKVDYPPNVPWLREKRAVGWDWDTCCLH